MSAFPIETFLENLEESWPEDALEYMPKENAYMELKKLTGQDFGYDVVRWKAWINTNWHEGQLKKDRQ